MWFYESPLGLDFSMKLPTLGLIENGTEIVGNHHVSMSTCDSWSADLKILVPNMNPGYLNST